MRFRSLFFPAKRLYITTAFANVVYIFNFEIKKGRNLTHKHTIFKRSGEHEHWNSIGVFLSQFWSV